MRIAVTEIEQESGTSWCAVDAESVPALQQQSRARATARCLALADELDATDPQRAQRLRTVANDPQRTTSERWGAYKNDSRAPRESQAEPEGMRTR